MYCVTVELETVYICKWWIFKAEWYRGIEWMLVDVLPISMTVVVFVFTDRSINKHICM